MKNFIKLTALIGCFLLVASTTVSSQDFVRNNTACSFEVKVAYGDVVGCDVNGFDIVTVGPFQQVNFPNTNGAEILYGKGRPVGTAGGDCAFYVAQGGCAPYGASDTILDPTCCGGYTATLFPGFGIYITN